MQLLTLRRKEWILINYIKLKIQQQTADISLLVVIVGQPVKGGIGKMSK
jgi:hypothetical protein